MQTMGRRLGAGLGYRLELHHDIAAHRHDIDFFEVSTEQFLHASPDRLASMRELQGEKAVVPHGAEMSVGTALPVRETYLKKVDDLLTTFGAPWFSDHLSFSRVPDLDVGQLTPLWFTEEALDVVRRNVKSVQKRIGVPFLLENITYYFPMPHGDMTEADFLSRTVFDTDCGLLLDLNNLHINSINLSFDPHRFLSKIPLDRVVQIHIAGGRPVFGMVVNNHGTRVHEEVWQLLEYVVRHSSVRGIVLEWDLDFPSFSVILDHLTRARQILRRFGAGRCESR